MEKLEGTGETARKKGDVQVPVCALASYGAQPLIAVGLSHGAVHIVFVKEVRSVLFLSTAQKSVFRSNGGCDHHQKPVALRLYVTAKHATSLT